MGYVPKRVAFGNTLYSLEAESGDLAITPDFALLYPGYILLFILARAEEA